MGTVITSSRNPKLKLVRSLMGRARERREAGQFVIEGVRLIEEATAASWKFHFVLYDRSLNERGKRQIEHLKSLGVEVEEISESLMKSVSGTETPQGILAVLEFTRLPVPNNPNLILIPDRIRDPGNLGTLLRSAAATGVQAVLLPPETTDPFAPKVLRSGMGAHFRLPLRETTWEEIEQICKVANLRVFLADMNGTSCWETDLRQPLALIIGGEAEGASREARILADQSIALPMLGNVESLNAAVAGSVLMFEILRQRR
ncbi:MAG TPA: RNA methyltransferase [Anaerolineales bacterium]|nr:RNA methyltransferase [Anaerolineales bacterium]